MKSAYLLLFIVFFSIVTVSGQEKFPVPTGNSKQLFYLQRTANTNTIVYELNFNNQVLVAHEPVHAFWVRFDEQGQKSELNPIQRKFAYGIKSQLISKDKYELNFVSYKKYPMYLIKGVYGTINQKQAIIKRIFVKINGGSFWFPSVEYVEIKGVDAGSGKELTERRKV